MIDDWDADFLTVQDHLDSYYEPLPADLQLRQYRRWEDFAMMTGYRALRFRRADTFEVGNEPTEGIVHDRVRFAFSRPEGDRMLKVLELAKHLYISCFTTNAESAGLWDDFAPHSEDVCIVTNAKSLQNETPTSVVMLRAAYGIDWSGSNPSDQIYQDRMDYEATCSVAGMEYETSGEFSFVRALKYLQIALGIKTK